MVSLYFFCHHIDFYFEFFVDVFAGFYVDFFIDLREVSDKLVVWFWRTPRVTALGLDF